MDLQRALITKILSEPDDDLPRLIFADWLEEHGDPRGEFIRLQCRLHGMTAADPDWNPCKERERDLLAARQKEWLGRLEKLHGTKLVFERGLLKQFVCSLSQFVQKDCQKALLKRLPYLGCERLWLHGGGGTEDLNQLLGCEALALFPRLTWNNSSLEDEDLARFVQSPRLGRLHSLTLGGFHFGFGGLVSLASSELLSRLRELSLMTGLDNFYRGKLPATGVVELLRGLCELRSLYLSGCKRFRLDQFLPAAGEMLQRLHSFQVRECMAMPLMPLATCPHFTNLRTLSVSNLIISNESLRAMIDNPAFERLQHFSLVPCTSKAPLDPEVLIALRDRFPKGDLQCR